MAREEFSSPVQNVSGDSLSMSGNVDVSDRASRDLGGVDIANKPTVSQTVLTGLTYGQDSVSTGGTAVALNGGTSVSVPDGATVRVKALASNGTEIYVGDSSVGTGSGYELASGEALYLQSSDVSNIYINCGTSGNGVSWIVEA